jgi:hypothetical protein
MPEGVRRTEQVPEESPTEVLAYSTAKARDKRESVSLKQHRFMAQPHISTDETAFVHCYSCAH